MPVLTYELRRECLNNVEDVAGRWQIEGGTVFQRNRHCRELLEREASQLWDAPAEHRDALADAVLPENAENAPENITLHGAHDFNSGGEIGSVSAASSTFAAHIGKQFKRVVNTLTIS